MLKYFLNPKKVISYMLKFVLGILNFQLLYRTLKIICLYVLNNTFSYVQSFFVFLLQKDSYFDHGDTDAFFLFLLEKEFYICPEPFSTFFLFLLEEDVDIFHVVLFEAFFSFSSSERFFYLS